MNENKDITTIKDLFLDIAAHYDSATIAHYDQVIGVDFKKKTFRCFLEQIAGFIHFFDNQDLKKGDRVCIVSNTTSSWMALDIAIMAYGLVSVPIFPNITKENLEFQLKDSSPSLIFLQSYSLKSFISECHIVEKQNIVYINDILPKGLEYAFNSLAICNQTEYDLATIVYTSGTGGVPKGVELTNKNIISQIFDISEIFDINQSDKAISFLPTTHIFQRIVCYLYIFKSVSIYFVNDHKTLPECMMAVKPTLMTVVPRVLEKILIKINTKFKQKKGLTGVIARLALKYAKKHNPDYKHNWVFHLYNFLVYRKIVKIFGGNIRMLISGGAKLDEMIYAFFTNIGIPVYQGYGLTEASPVISTNHPSSARFPTVGQSLKSVKVKLAPDGELLASGPSIMNGYHNNIEATNQVLKGNFLYTGDLAKIDKDGFITIIGRKKEQFKTSTGKYVDPIKLEQMLNLSPNIEHSCIIADGRQFVSVIIFVSPSGNQQKIKDAVSRHINKINKKLEHHERIVEFVIVSKVISPETGELTPSLKLRRHILYEQYQKEIDNMYNKNNS